MTIDKAKELLTQNEFNTFKILIRLGDDIDLAFDTVVKEREREQMKEQSREFYKNAYEN